MRGDIKDGKLHRSSASCSRRLRRFILMDDEHVRQITVRFESGIQIRKVDSDESENVSPSPCLIAIGKLRWTAQLETKVSRLP